VLEVNPDVAGINNKTSFRDRSRSYVGGVCYSDFLFNVATISRLREDCKEGNACGLDSLSV
jgi:hypothetical protein